ncbi:MAG: hypothetical protein QM617_06880, partial [Comamonas sp.]
MTERKLPQTNRFDSPAIHAVFKCRTAAIACSSLLKPANPISKPPRGDLSMRHGLKAWTAKPWDWAA